VFPTGDSLLVVSSLVTIGKSFVIVSSANADDGVRKPPLDENFRLCSGESGGWYNGGTLSVETRNFHANAFGFSLSGNSRDKTLPAKFTRTEA